MSVMAAKPYIKFQDDAYQVEGNRIFLDRQCRNSVIMS